MTCATRKASFGGVSTNDSTREYGYLPQEDIGRAV